MKYPATPKQMGRTNRRPAFILKSGRQLEIVSCDPPSVSAPVAEFLVVRLAKPNCSHICSNITLYTSKNDRFSTGGRAPINYCNTDRFFISENSGFLTIRRAGGSIANFRPFSRHCGEIHCHYNESLRGPLSKKSGFLRSECSQARTAFVDATCDEEALAGCRVDMVTLFWKNKTMQNTGAAPSAPYTAV